MNRANFLMDCRKHFWDMSDEAYENLMAEQSARFYLASKFSTNDAEWLCNMQAWFEVTICLIAWRQDH